MKVISAIHKSIGIKVKQHRKMKGFSQDMIGSYLGLTKTSIANIEAGRHMPSFEALYNFCCLVGVEVGEMFPSITPIEFTIEAKKVEVIKTRTVKTLKIKSDATERTDNTR
jgi:DNA-binding XRE family transcriptional regulator